MNQSQLSVFASALAMLKGELDSVLSDMQFPEMLEELRRVIKSLGISSKARPVRFFARHYLNMRGERYLEVHRWLAGTQEMSVKDVVLVLSTLQGLKNGDLEFPMPLSKKVVVGQTGKVSPPPTGLTRQIIDHSVGTFQSVAGLIAEAGVTPALVFDSDRMQMQSVLENISNRFGITATFHSTTTAEQPLSQRDLTNLGLSRRKKS